MSSSSPPQHWKKQLPLWATYSRFFSAFLLFVILSLPIPGKNYWGALLFILSSITDWLDGYWARKYDARTTLGQFMDPIADKVLVLSALILLVHEHKIDPFAPALLLSRDIFIGGIRSIAAAHQLIIDAKSAGKWKTALQMVAIPCLILGDIYWQDVGLGTLNEFLPLAYLPLMIIGKAVIWVSVFFSLISAIEYTQAYLERAKEDKK